MSLVSPCLGDELVVLPGSNALDIGISLLRWLKFLNVVALDQEKQSTGDRNFHLVSHEKQIMSCLKCCWIILVDFARLQMIQIAH